MGVREKDPLAQLSLPPGFRFYPTDEELLVQYLCRKVAGYHFSLQIIGDIDLYKFDPWDLPIITSDGHRVGIKKALVFYAGKAPKGTKTNWIMHEYRLIEHSRSHGSSKLDDWVLCRIYKKMSGSQRQAVVSPEQASLEDQSTNGSPSSCSSQLDDVIDSFPEMKDQYFNLPRMNSLRTILNGNFDWASLAGLNPIPELAPTNGVLSYGGYDALRAAEGEAESWCKDQQQNTSELTQSFGYSSSGFGLSGQIYEFR
ncbi:unnamed protein product [Eruca vesicaria subsp. sativa]|uniref:NAC domain-containing protein n=1 Tax=Eruca vesicaria subsp. sativa TaxID=29727 RepID=A0ABC8J8I0_ERUVS|nr:unnamed protein product [Eruca vesicaria subsp. sativa]